MNEKWDAGISLPFACLGHFERIHSATHGTFSDCVTSRLSATAVELLAHCFPYSDGKRESSCIANSLPTPMPINADTGMENRMFRGCA
jgi:hypothetical protein